MSPLGHSIHWVSCMPLYALVSTSNPLDVFVIRNLGYLYPTLYPSMPTLYPSIPTLHPSMTILYPTLHPSMISTHQWRLSIHQWRLSTRLSRFFDCLKEKTWSKGIIIILTWVVFYVKTWNFSNTSRTGNVFLCQHHKQRERVLHWVKRPY